MSLKPLRARKRHVEDDHQQALIAWASVARVPFPPRADRPRVLDYLFAIPNGGQRAIAEAKRMKAQGVKAGVSDLFLPLMRHGYGGLWIEMKKPATSATGRGATSAEQRDWRDLMLAAGYLAVVSYGWDEARQEIERYLNVSAA